MINYDVFISCKSEDYPYAHLIYKFLTDELGYVVFLADAELRKKGVAEYGEVIDEALDSAEHLILFSSKVEYINSSYVRNEWRTFLEEKRSGRKPGNILTVLKDVTISSLPISLRHFQSFTYDRYKDVKDFLPHSTPKHSSISTPAPAKTDKVGDYYNDGVREEAERKAREEAARKAREEAERKAREEAARKAREEAERKAREEAERKAREEAARKAREEAERRAREEAGRKAREEAERKAREEAARKAQNKKYNIGDYYNDGVREGVVFEVSADGRHGKIVSMRQSGNLKWSSDSAEQKRLIGADSETNGEYNMAKVKAISGWRSKYPAFKWCADLGEGWYLPSIDELKTFTLNDAVHDAVNRTLIARGGTKLYDRGEWEEYWSSTERNEQYGGEFCVWGVVMYDGYINGLKSSSHYVRAVATIGEDILEDDVRAFVEKERKAREEAERRRRLGIYAVGDYYNDGVREGVIFEVSADGRHGKIVSMKQSAEELPWAINERKFGLFKSEAERLIGADSKTDGAYNMAKVKAISGWRDKYPPFAWCADLGEGWYLPSIEELKVFTLNTAVHDAVNRTLIARGGTKLYDRGEKGWYWSSTEYDKQYDGEFCAWLVSMNDGYTDYNDKSGNFYVRAVSAF